MMGKGLKEVRVLPVGTGEAERVFKKIMKRCLYFTMPPITSIV